MKIYIFSKKFILLGILIIVTVFFGIYFSIKPTLDLTCSASTSSNNLMDKIISNNTEKTAYLTFDDGPNASITPKVLEILKEENVKASFFVIGKHVEQYPEIVKQVYDEGHFIANHGYSHDNSLLYKSSTSFIDEIKKTDLAIGNAIGVDNYCSHIFRFPNGLMAPLFKTQKNNMLSVLSNMDYFYIDWNCLNNDSAKKCSSSELLHNLINSSKDKNPLVILMHDTKDVSNSSLVLKDSIEYLKNQGFVFKNFYDVLNQ